jgi:hypothetical protein
LRHLGRVELNHIGVRSCGGVDTASGREARGFADIFEVVVAFLEAVGAVVGLPDTKYGRPARTASLELDELRTWDGKRMMLLETDMGPGPGWQPND